jgi:hypothetical protein
MMRADSWAALYRRRVASLTADGMPDKLAIRIAEGESRGRQRLAGLIGTPAAKLAELICVGERSESGEETVRFALSLPRSSAPPHITSASFAERNITFVRTLR